MNHVINRWIEEMQRIKNGDFSTDVGICSNVRILHSILEFGFPSWPKFSGNIEYPVPHPQFTPVKGYDYALINDILWDKETQYGRDRWELVDFLIEFYQQCEMFVVSNMSVTPTDEYTGCNEDVFRVLVHIPSVPEDLQDLEFLVQCWHDKKLLEQYSSFCIEM